MAATQSVEANAMGFEVDLATHQSMQPQRAGLKGPAKQMDVASIVAAAQEDKGAIEPGVQIEPEMVRERSPIGSLFTPPDASGVVCVDVALRGGNELAESAEMVPLP